MRRNENVVEVTWMDALVYDKYTPTPISLPIKVTMGVVVKKNNEGIIIKDPKTFSKKGCKLIKDKFKKRPTFLYLPRKMIIKQEGNVL